MVTVFIGIRLSCSVFKDTCCRRGEKPAQFLKIRVAEEGKNKVNVTIPISLIEVGLKIGAKVGPKFSPEAEVLKEIDLDELMQAVKEGAKGKIVDIEDDGDKVEIFIE